jgi:DNA modification methylase/DNA-binding Lrp family transcriptional regulator
MEDAKTIGVTSKQIAAKVNMNEEEVKEFLKILKNDGIVTQVGRGLWILKSYQDMSKDPYFIPPEFYLKEFQQNFKVKIESYRKKITFSGNGSRIIHRWSPYVQGFSASFVDDMIVRHRISKNQWILDPFVGSGTVPVCAKIKGINSLGIDLMPLMTFMSKVKTTWQLSLSGIRQDLERINKSWRTFRPSLSKSFLKETERQFKPEVLESLLSLKELILGIGNQKIKNLFLLAFASILVECSNLKRSPCLGYVKDKKVDKDAPFKLLKEKIEQMLTDLTFVQDHHEDVFAELILGDARVISYEPNSFDIAITSPPYVNGMDYIINYKIEMSWLDLVKNYEDLERLKKQMVACDNIPKKVIQEFKQKKWIYHDEWLEDVCGRIANRIEQKGSYRRDDMHLIVRKYFEDLYPVFKRVYEGLKVGGRFIIVIGDSLIAGIYIPADLILAKLGREVGFSIERIEIARERRSGQRRDFLLRESIVTLRKT